jgi:hypothetical protein
MNAMLAWLVIAVTWIFLPWWTALPLTYGVLVYDA